MQFFVPHATDADQAERVWQSVKAFLAKQGLRTTDQRIASISFRHNGKPCRAVVGERFEDLREVAIAIFEGDGSRLYYLCTPTRGVVHDEPYLIGKDDSTHVTPFDD